jgi:hypothetical protein
MTSLADFQSFAQNVMGVSPTVLPLTSPAYLVAYDLAAFTVNNNLNCIQPTTPLVGVRGLYEIAFNNLAGHYLILFAQDSPTNPNPTYWADLRNSLGLNSFTAGVIIQASDQGTAASIQIADWVKNLSIDELECLKTPYGRMYLSIAQKAGTVWGIS